MFYDLLEPLRLGDQHLAELTLHLSRALRAEGQPRPKEPDVRPRVSGDLLLPRGFRAPVAHNPSIPRWESERGGRAWWSSDPTESSGDGQDDGSAEGLDGA